MKSLHAKNAQLSLPVFFPDATKGVVRSIDTTDIQNTGVEGIVVNTFHLTNNPGITIMKEAGGIKNFMGWKGFVISDSGGFQLLSMIHDNPVLGSVNRNGFIFYKGKARQKNIFTPEKSIQMQFVLQSDVMVCLDDCPKREAGEEENTQSVERTIAWAKRSKDEYMKQLSLRTISSHDRPLLFAVIQGGNDKAARKRCAEALIAIGFDGYGFGGWPLDERGNLNTDILSYTAALMPSTTPKYALGVGNPQAILDCFLMGYTIFDCVLPTRDARHERLYVFSKDPKDIDIKTEKQVYEFIHISKDIYKNDTTALSAYCDCSTCTNYSKAYLHHLFMVKDSTAGRLATIHNLRMYTMLMQLLRRYDK